MSVETKETVEDTVETTENVNEQPQQEVLEVPEFLTKGLEECSMDELILRKELYQRYIYTTNILLTGDSRNTIKKLIDQLGQGVPDMGIDSTEALYWLRETLDFKVLTVHSPINLAVSGDLVDNSGYNFECFGVSSYAGEKSYHYTILFQNQQDATYTASRLAKIEGAEVFYKTKNETNNQVNPHLNYLTFMALQQMINNAVNTPKTLDILYQFLQMFKDMNFAIHQNQLGIQQVDNEIKERKTNENAQRQLQNMGMEVDLDTLINNYKEETYSLDDLKKEAAALRVRAINLGVDTSVVSTGRQRNTIIREITELHDIIKEATAPKSVDAASTDMETPVNTAVITPDTSEEEE